MESLKNILINGFGRKIEASKNKNSGQRTLAKLMLNSLYGKFATSLTAINKIPNMDSSGVVTFTNGEEKPKSGLYLPIRGIYNSIRTRKDNPNISSDKRLFNKEIRNW